MPKRLTIYHPTEVRTYGLKDLAVPPQRYAEFLLETVEAVNGLILQENKCQSLDEVAEKYARAMKRINSGKSEEELFLGSPLAVWADAKLDYNKSISTPQKPNKLYRSIKYEERIGMPKRSSRIDLKTAKKDLAGFVDYLDEELNRRFPRRKGKMPDHIFNRNKRETSICNSPCGFRFGLHFQSEPTLYLEASVQLVNFGAISGGNLKHWYSIPAIEVEAKHLIAGSMALPRKVVEALGEIVTKHYKIGGIEYKTSYMNS